MVSPACGWSLGCRWEVSLGCPVVRRGSPKAAAEPLSSRSSGRTPAWLCPQGPAPLGEALRLLESQRHEHLLVRALPLGRRARGAPCRWGFFPRPPPHHHRPTFPPRRATQHPRPRFFRGNHQGSGCPQLRVASAPAPRAGALPALAHPTHTCLSRRPRLRGGEGALSHSVMDRVPALWGRVGPTGPSTLRLAGGALGVKAGIPLRARLGCGGTQSPRGRVRGRSAILGPPLLPSAQPALPSSP